MRQWVPSLQWVLNLCWLLSFYYISSWTWHGGWLALNRQLVLNMELPHLLWADGSYIPPCFFWINLLNKQQDNDSKLSVTSHPSLSLPLPTHLKDPKVQDGPGLGSDQAVWLQSLSAPNHYPILSLPLSSLLPTFLSPGFLSSPGVISLFDILLLL